MVKRFVFNHPAQLKEIAKLCKDSGNTMIVNTAKVWSSVMRQKEKTPWDGRIGVSFYTEGRERKACVFRFGTNDQMRELGFLKYNAALKWCEAHLKQSDGF